MTAIFIVEVSSLPVRQIAWGCERQAGEVGHPAGYIVAAGIELLALKYGVEHTEIRGGVGAAARDPLPACVAAGGIGVDQRVPETALTQPPLEHQFLGQEGDGYQAHAIVP